MPNKVTQQFFGGLLGLPEGSNPFAYQENGRNVPFSKLLWRVGSPGGWGMGAIPGRGGGGVPGDGGGGGGGGSDGGGGTTPPTGAPRWAFPQYTQTWAFTPPAPQWYPAPPKFDASKYPSSIPTKK